MQNHDYIAIPASDAPATFHGPAFEPRWIPVSERLPAHREWVWFYRAVGSGDVMRGMFVSDERGCFISGGHRYWHPGERVTHWMPSPTPEPPV